MRNFMPIHNSLAAVVAFHCHNGYYIENELGIQYLGSKLVVVALSALIVENAFLTILFPKVL